MGGSLGLECRTEPPPPLHADLLSPGAGQDMDRFKSSSRGALWGVPQTLDQDGEGSLAKHWADRVLNVM